MDLQVAGLADLEDRLGTALERIGELQAGTRVQTDTFFSGEFMDAHTEFDSFAAFCDRSPRPLDDVGDVQDLPRERLDEYVAATTEFESWEEMKTGAAEEAIIDRVVA